MQNTGSLVLPEYDLSDFSGSIKAFSGFIQSYLPCFSNWNLFPDTRLSLTNFNLLTFAYKNPFGQILSILQEQLKPHLLHEAFLVSSSPQRSFSPFQNSSKVLKLLSLLG